MPIAVHDRHLHDRHHITLPHNGHWTNENSAVRPNRTLKFFGKGVELACGRVRFLSHREFTSNPQEPVDPSNLIPYCGHSPSKASISLIEFRSQHHRRPTCHAVQAIFSKMPPTILPSGNCLIEPI